MASNRVRFLHTSSIGKSIDSKIDRLNQENARKKKKQKELEVTLTRKLLEFRANGGKI